MKKILISLICLVLLMSTFVFAEEATNVVVDPNMLTDQPSGTDLENGVMPISEEGTEPIEELTQELNDEQETPTIIEGDVFKYEDHTIISEDSVDGDIYIFSNEVEVLSNNIYGNVFIIADKVTIKSNVTGYGFIIANNIEVEGDLRGLYVLSKNLHIADGAYIQESIKTISNDVDIGGMVNRNLVALANNVKVQENAMIYGDLVSNANVEAGENSIIGKTTKLEGFENTETENNNNESIFSSIINFCLKLLTALIVIFVLTICNKEGFKNENTKVIDYCKDIGKGLLYVILIPIVSILLMITGIGFSIGIIAIALYFIILYLSIFVTSLVIAKLILEYKNKDSIRIRKFLAVGVYGVLQLVGFIPIIGSIIYIVALLLGFSFIMKSIISKRKKQNNNEA